MSEVQAPDPSDPAYWNDPKFKVKAPKPDRNARMSCPKCSGTAYGDGTGGYVCFACKWST